MRAHLHAEASLVPSAGVGSVFPHRRASSWPQLAAAPTAPAWPASAHLSCLTSVPLLRTVFPEAQSVLVILMLLIIRCKRKVNAVSSFIHLINTCFGACCMLHTAFGPGEAAVRACPCGGYLIVEERANRHTWYMLGGKCHKEKAR